MEAGGFRGAAGVIEFAGWGRWLGECQNHPGNSARSEKRQARHRIGECGSGFDGGRVSGITARRDARSRRISRFGTSAEGARKTAGKIRNLVSRFSGGLRVI